MKYRLITLSLLCAALLCGCNKGADSFRTGSKLPMWQEGWLDIHAINTGRGESFWFIFPDGTTMLLDASGSLPQETHPLDPPGCISRPSPDISAGRVIIHYVNHFMPAAANGKIDYFMLSHYHGDHMGAWRANPEKHGIAVHPEGGFELLSLGEIASEIPIGTIIDRGPYDDRASKDYFTKDGIPRYEDYLRMAAWCNKTYGTVHERLKVGYDDQIVLKHHPEKYPDFKVMNLAAGGYVWTGTGHQVDSTLLPSAAECLAFGSLKEHKILEGNPLLAENNFSCVIRLSYGMFDYFTGGDIQHKGRAENPIHDIETPISKVVDKTEVVKLGHHGTSSTCGESLMEALCPDVALAANWRDVQPNPISLKRILAVNPDVKLIMTNSTDHNLKMLRDEEIDPDSFLSREGHVVFRVEPSGEQYWVIILNDRDEKYKIKSVHGPYPCHP